MPLCRITVPMKRNSGTEVSTKLSTVFQTTDSSPPSSAGLTIMMPMMPAADRLIAIQTPANSRTSITPK